MSALDLSTQARVLDLFMEIQERTGVAYLFISHDLAVVRHLSHRVAVMYHGEIVESGDGDQVTARPRAPLHPAAVPGLARCPTRSGRPGAARSARSSSSRRPVPVSEKPPGVRFGAAYYAEYQRTPTSRPTST